MGILRQPPKDFRGYPEATPIYIDIYILNPNKKKRKKKNSFRDGKTEKTAADGRREEGQSQGFSSVLLPAQPGLVDREPDQASPKTTPQSGQGTC